MRKWAGSAQFSPALGALSVMIGIGAVCYVYRNLIWHTFLWSLAAIAIITATGLIIAFALNMIRRHQSPAPAARLAVPEVEPVPAGVPDDTVDGDTVSLSLDPEGHVQAGWPNRGWRP